ncbi:MAG: ketoacyl-ACP synthase III [Spirochaetes bacterium]|nr:ketoacyl-ACP synthase III [Spirochaetota bacterium]MBU1081370.1 ketoacyl-ACP synthase III [Spirochaetota bacterium]
MSIVISGTGAFIPENRVSNEELAARVDTTDEWIRSHTGIGARRFAADGLVSSDLGAAAARVALERAGKKPEDVDLIVVATATPDYFAFPSTACIVQDKLGAANAAALDINAGCTGFIYALDVAGSMLAAPGRRTALVIGAETLSRIADWGDRATCVLFGDGAAAFVLERDDNAPGVAGGGSGLLFSWLRAKGSGAKSLYLSQPERTKTFERVGDCGKPPAIIMDGKSVYMFAVKAITDTIEALLAESGYALGDFKWIVPHQANLRIVQAAAKRFGIADEQIFMNIEEYANTSAASIPIAMNEMAEKGLLKKGDLVMAMGFGAGLTYGGAIIRW